MSTLEHFSANVKDRLDDLAVGWQHLWHRAGQAITRFTPASRETAQDESANQHPALEKSSNRWGLLTAEVIEHDQSLEVCLEAPGMHADDFSLSVDSQGLTVTGEKYYEQARDVARYHLTERAYGRFTRHIALPTPVHERDVSAVYRDGVLKITLPKAEPGHRRRIHIE